MNTGTKSSWEDKSVDGKTDGYAGRKLHKCLEERVCGYMGACMDGCMDAWVSGWLRSMNRQTGRLIDKLMGRWAVRY